MTPSPAEKRFAQWTHWYAVFLLSLLTACLTVVAYSAWQLRAHTWSAARTMTPSRRILDKWLGWRSFPNLRMDDHGRRDAFVTNAYGFRSKDGGFPAESEVALVGDSFVEGYFLPWEETVGAQLERRLGKPVANLGVGGYSTDQEFTVAREFLTRFHTRWIVQLFNSNDLWPLERDRAWKYEKPRYAISPEGTVDFDRLLPARNANDIGSVFQLRRTFPDEIEPVPSETSFTPSKWQDWQSRIGDNFELIQKTFFGGEARNEESLELVAAGYPPTVYQDPRALSREWGIAFQFFDRMRDLARAAGAGYLLVFIPEVNQVRWARQRDLFAPQARFRALCEAHRLDCLEPHETFVKADRQRDVYFGDDVHLTAHGSGLTARLIAEQLMKLVPPAVK